MAGLCFPPGSSPSAQGIPLLEHLPSMVDTDANPASLVNTVQKLPPKLATYNNCGVSSNPEIVIVGDSAIGN